ncbi:RNA 2'-phosphotransferase [Massilia sp. PAMC28688]|uniref:RNA 2'-phosphotransferase n=1 Tax=Massilia sp. PAMC28688 TaxID=2861283 RepID=UPI001C6366A1|nr:RNA 2'-phosphotransferase [Massilia sp. PAMC28688]QYF93324.1 RNA 2'-phosphotransferase [Massilia sp. PAMC28688]
MGKRIERASRLLSLILRHDPGAIGLALDRNGWADVDELLRLANASGRALTRPLLLEVVARNDKQRFALDAGATRIRANQGHSIDVDLQLEPEVPPAHLYHGTAIRFLVAIRAQGLLPGARRHVHLSADLATARTVGARHGKAHVLLIRAADMHHDGHHFYRSANGVWLTAAVPARYIAA